MPTDVTNRGDRALFATVKEKYGRLDVLFNNAGMGAPPVPFEELPLEKWKEVVDINLTALFVCSHEAIKIMKDQSPRGGRIINNGSISAHTPRPRSVAYTSTKHAVTGLTKSIALDGRAYDVACSQVDIGNAATPMTDRMVTGVLQPSGKMMPEPRMDAEHVGAAVAYMASLPLDANVLFMTVMATKMPFVGRDNPERAGGPKQNPIHLSSVCRERQRSIVRAHRHAPLSHDQFHNAALDPPTSDGCFLSGGLKRVYPKATREKRA